MVEIYYEQMSYEVLSESESYLVNQKKKIYIKIFFCYLVC